MPGVSEKKIEFLKRVEGLFKTYTKILLVGADNVGSNQFQKIRQSLRGKAVILMGKKSLIRRALRAIIKNNKSLESLMPLIKENVGLVFSNDDLSEVKKIISASRVGAPAKVGALAPVDVIVPAGPTGMDPTMTSFLQALNISSKITKGQVEIISDVHLIKKGEKVSASEATLLEKLRIRPFSYGLDPKTVYDSGSIYEASVLDLTAEDILKGFQVGIANVTALSLGVGQPNAASIPHMLLNGYKNILSVGFGTNYTFARLEKLKNSAAAAPAKAAAKKEAAAPAKKEAAPAKKEEPKAEEPADDDMGFGLFD